MSELNPFGFHHPATRPSWLPVAVPARKNSVRGRVKKVQEDTTVAQFRVRAVERLGEQIADGITNLDRQREQTFRSEVLDQLLIRNEAGAAEIMGRIMRELGRDS